MRMIIPAAIGLWGALLSSTVAACPECSASVRAEVRRGIYGEAFGFNLFATVLPFGIFLAFTALIHSGLPTILRPNPRRRP